MENITELIEITPDDSVVPVFLQPLTKLEEEERSQRLSEEQARLASLENQLIVKSAALAKLAKLGFTPEEIQAITN